MQIRELTLKELYTAYGVVSQLRQDLSYKEFEDLIYDMRHIEYKMFGIFERGELVNYAGVSVSTSLSHKRHLLIYDFVTDAKQRTKGYGTLMLEYLRDYAKTCLCGNIILFSDLEEKEHLFYEKNGFKKINYLFIQKV